MIHEKVRNAVWWVISNLILMTLSAWAGYCWTRSVSDISYSVATPRPVIYDAAFAPEVALVTPAGEVHRDAWAITVWVWNRGQHPSQPPFRRTPRLTLPQARILSATIRRATHPDDCRFRIDDSQRNAGVLGLSWDILRHNEGAAIEIVYTGSRMAEVRMDAISTEQYGMTEARFMRRTNEMFGILAWMFIALVVISIPAARLDQWWVSVVAVVLWMAWAWLVSVYVWFGIPHAIDVG